MTVDELITEVLRMIRNGFYAGRDREFKRDERALMKAVLRYGYECDQRGWQFDSQFIFRQLAELLRQIRTSAAAIDYLPVYLDGAVKRSIGQHAEELSAAAKSIQVNATRIISGIKGVEAVREPTAVEVCAKVFNELRRTRKRRPSAKTKQGSFF